MIISCTSDHRLFFWSLLLSFFIFFGDVSDRITVQAAEEVTLSDKKVNVADLIEQLYIEIIEQVDQKKLPKKRRSRAEMLKRSYEKRQIQLAADLEILKIDALAASDDKIEIIEKLINTAINKERVTFEYLINLQILRNPSAKFEPITVTHLPPSTFDQPHVNNSGDKSEFTIKWVPDDVNSGVHD
ncbi:hypothetical protein DSCW_48440 [Desulfosarcina widdelii]|uniref:Uncharacterized protein n=1 Tax=Desulfosarcina widdelii TaxID=947919 RepID=A0A5K7ZMU5_9BACT|nr:hypothetical protein [Desulfosarcina widdelii]BBO77427.1 hypothetical protein DSCW_48440 [Desulfosarcina widdelii]